MAVSIPFFLYYFLQLSLQHPKEKANKEELGKLLTHYCNVAITACRSRGVTIESVEELADRYECEVIYVNLMHGDNPKYQNLYSKKNAEAICEIIDDLLRRGTSCKNGKFKPIP